MKVFPYLAAMALAAMSLSGCSTVKVPDIDFLKLPEFREIVKNNQTNVPDVSEVPAEPDDVRSDEAWDTDAQRLLALRDGLTVPESDLATLSQQEIDADYARNKAKAQAYKLDDPQ